MKSILKIALLGAIVLTSCTKDEVVNQNANLAISFDTYIAKSTKTAPTTGTAFADGATMGVYAYNTQAADWSGSGIDAITLKPLINEKVTKEGTGNWTYTNTAYYVKDEKISFLAYAPHMEGVQVADGKLEHQVSTVLAEQKDLMIAAPVTNKSWDGTPTTVMDDITFSFKHALSQVKFKALLNEEYTDYSIKVNSITLKALKNSGKISLTATEINWSDISGSQNYTMNFGENTLTTTAGELVAAGGEGDIFMLLPQTLTNAVFTFNITATPTAAGTEAGKTTKTRDFDVIVESGTWDPSNIYVYTATLTMDFDAPAIEFGEPTIEEWTAETDVPIQN